MSMLPAPPRSIAGNPFVVQSQQKIQALQRRNSLLKQEAKQAQPPVVQAACTLAGGAAQGALMAYLPAQRVPFASLALGLAAIFGGSIWSSPEAVSFGSGILAPLASVKTAEFLTQQRSRSRPASDSSGE